MNKLFVHNIGDLAEAQRASFFRFLTIGITEELESFTNPFKADTRFRSPALRYLLNSDENKKKRMQTLVYLHTGQVKLGQEDFSIMKTCFEKELTYAIPIYVSAEYILTLPEELLEAFLESSTLIQNKEELAQMTFLDIDKKTPMLPSIRYEQDIFFGEIPLMTEEGTFIINGCERVVISQIIRSPGIYFRKEGTSIRNTSYTATLISNRGLWTKFVFDWPFRMYIKLNEFKRKSSDARDRKDEDKNKLFLTDIMTYFGFSLQELADSLEYPDEFLNCHSRDGWKLKVNGDTESQEAKKKEIRKINRAKRKAKEKQKDYKEKKKKKPNSKFLRIPEVDNDEMSEFIKSMFFNQRSGCFSIGEIGRYKINKRLNLKIPLDIVHLTPLDFLGIINGLMDLKYKDRPNDDIDEIKNKLIRSVGELLQIQFRGALYTLQKQLTEKGISPEEEWKEEWIPEEKKFGIGPTRETFNPVKEGNELDEQTKEKKPFYGMDLEEAIDLDHKYHDYFDHRVITSSIRDFFKTSQLSQFMDQTNPLAELTHKRRISVFGPNGLKRDHISTVIRDIHPSQYGRLCPIETPEGQNAGLITSVALMGRISALGSIETPYFFMDKEQIYSSKRPIFLNPEQESETRIAFCDTAFDSSKTVTKEYVSVKENNLFSVKKMDEVNFMTTSPLQIVSLATALIPFIEHNDANRALMGSNMQRQAVPLLYPQKPIIGTGLEAVAIIDSGMVIKSYGEGVVSYACSRKIIIVDTGNQKIQYGLKKYRRSNQETCLNQRPIVWQGEKVFSGQIIADGPSTNDGELSLGRNLMIGYLPWEGYNYEDAIIINERILTEDCLTSVHIEEYHTNISVNVYGRDKCSKALNHLTKYIRRNLNPKTGIVRIGSYVKPHDILVGKLTPCEEDFSPEKKLIRVLFKRAKEKEYKDTSLKVTQGSEGRVIEVRILHQSDYSTKIREEKRKKNHALRRVKKLISEVEKNSTQQKRRAQKLGENWNEKEIEKERREKDQQKKQAALYEEQRKVKDTEEKIQLDKHKLYLLDENNTYTIKIFIAQIRKIQVGDKLAGRHGNKGIVSRILPRQDMPYLPDGTPLDILFNPLGVPSRMNVGQVFECLLGLAGEKLGKRFKVFPFDEIYGKEASRILVNQKLKEASIKSETPWLFNSYYPGKILLRDGRTGEYFDNPITVGKSYILKLIHLVEDKIHARSTGPYAMITEQPLAGKSQKGGQRFGEMEVWALEGYGCSNTLQELLTIKSDDIDGRNDMYESILIRKEIEKPKPSIPESFLTLIRELNALGLDFSSRKINAGLMTSYKGKVKKAKEEPEVEEERDLFKQVELRLKLRALLARKKSEQFTIEEEVHSEEEKKKQNQRKEDYRKVLENFRKIQDENRK
jgi:DNA-directed RNA polymerase subunit beta